jgi:cytochrome c biogenesis protein CcdA
MEIVLIALSSLWLGILTSISPCPLATNIAALSFITRDVDRAPRVFASGALYTLGRAAAYTVLAALLVTSVLSAPPVSHFLQTHMGRILGPVLVLAGMALLGLIRVPGLDAVGDTARLQRRFARSGVWGAAVLGFVFALSFCPVSAALFFGSLLPLALSHESRVLLPALYGVGTAIPVIALALALTLGARRFGRIFDRTADIERWLRRGTGVVFVVTGVYLSLANIFGVVG